jgi:fumarate hydratase class II
MDSLAEAISALAAIAAELRQIADDLRDLMGGRQEPEVDALVITEVESQESQEEEES